MTGGYLVSFWNRPFFPEFCSDSTLDDSKTYDTMVRIGGSWEGVGKTFKAVAGHFGWTHIAMVTDDKTKSYCWYGAKPIDGAFGNNDNYTFSWPILDAVPTDEELDAALQQARARARGLRSSQLHMS